MRAEYELEVLGQYDIEVKSTRKIRGAFFCDTDEGTMLLVETKISGQRAPLLYLVLDALEKSGNIKADTPVFTRDGGLLAESREGKRYMLKKWYRGRECDVHQEREVRKAAERLAVLHLELESIPRGAEQFAAPALLTGRDPAEEIRRYNRELKKIRSFIRGRAAKNEFEYLFLDSFEKMYRQAEYVLDRMERSGAAELYRKSVKERSLAHGAYNYHNLLVTDGDMAVTGFEHMHIGIQVHDLYYFLRKIMEKCSWKQNNGLRILEAYEDARKLTPQEREYVGLWLAYPEKYWKTASTYYHSGKAWLPPKYIEKLEISVRQDDEKRAFLENVFSV